MVGSLNRFRFLGGWNWSLKSRPIRSMVAVACGSACALVRGNILVKNQRSCPYNEPRYDCTSRSPYSQLLGFGFSFIFSSALFWAEHLAAHFLQQRVVLL